MNLRADLDSASELRLSVALGDLKVARRMALLAADGVDKMEPRPALAHANLLLAISALDDAKDDLDR